MSISVNLGKVIPSNAGTWSSSITYPVLTYVKYNNGFYLSKIQNINKQPDINTSEWQVIINADQVISDVNNATQNANMAVASISDIVAEFDNKIDLPKEGTSDQFIRGDGSVIDLAYGQFTISDNYQVHNPDETSIIPIDTDVINHNIILDEENHHIEILQPGIYNITLKVTVLNKGGEYSVIHIYNLMNNSSIASSLYNHFDEKEYTLNCSVLNHFNEGDKIGFYIEYSDSPTIINSPVSYEHKPGFNSILTNVNIQQIK